MTGGDRLTGLGACITSTSNRGRTLVHNPPASCDCDPDDEKDDRDCGDVIGKCTNRCAHDDDGADQRYPGDEAGLSHTSS